MRILMFWDILWYIMAAKSSTVRTLNEMTHSWAKKWMNLEPMYQPNYHQPLRVVQQEMDVFASLQTRMPETKAQAAPLWDEEEKNTRGIERVRSKTQRRWAFVLCVIAPEDTPPCIGDTALRMFSVG